MHRSHVIEVSGRFAGAAITHGDQFRFVAIDPRAEELDDSLWNSLSDLQRVVQHLLNTGRLPRAAHDAMGRPEFGFPANRGAATGRSAAASAD